MAQRSTRRLPVVILAIELLLFEFRSRSFIPLVIAVHAARQRTFSASRPALDVQHGKREFDALHGLPFYLLLGVLSGVAANLLHESALTGWKINSTDCRLTTSGIPPLARWGSALSVFLYAHSRGRLRHDFRHPQQYLGS